MASAQTKITVGCLFSGMGGFASGLAKAGFEIRWASDNDTPYIIPRLRTRLNVLGVLKLGNLLSCALSF